MIRRTATNHCLRLDANWRPFVRWIAGAEYLPISSPSDLSKNDGWTWSSYSGYCAALDFPKVVQFSLRQRDDSGRTTFLSTSRIQPLRSPTPRREDDHRIVGISSRVLDLEQIPPPNQVVTAAFQFHWGQMESEGICALRCIRLNEPPSASSFRPPRLALSQWPIPVFLFRLPRHRRNRPSR